MNGYSAEKHWIIICGQRIKPKAGLSQEAYDMAVEFTKDTQFALSSGKIFAQEREYIERVLDTVCMEADELFQLYD